MKKKEDDCTFCHKRKVKKCLTCCMFIILFLCTGWFTSKADTLNPKDSVTFKTRQMMVEQVFDAITQQLKYDVFYSENELDVKQMVQIPQLKMGLADVLNHVLKNNFVYKFKENTIVVSPVKQVSSSTRTINGIVKDEKGNPLPGVTVLVKGTSIGVATNVKGQFKLLLPGTIKDAQLIVSFIGMKTVSLLADKDFLSVVMKENVNEMEEVIVRTGFENIDKRKLTSSVVTVKMDDIMEPVTNTLDKMLQGKIPGMAVLQQSSTVGATPKIRIRGSSSILGNRDPLWVLDGIILEDPVPLNVADLNSMDKVNLIGNAISGINPQDIDQIDILKDASATALYGIKAANGVIMITTKRGKFGVPSIGYNTSMSFLSRPTTKMMHIMNSAQRVEVSEEIVGRGLEYVGLNPTGDVGYEGLLMKLYNNQYSYADFKKATKKLKELNTDWYKILFRNAFSQSHTLSVSGANETINYYFSIGYSNMQGAMIQEKNERYNFTSNLNIKISPKFRVGFNLAVSNGETHRPHSSIDLYQYAYTTTRALSPYNEDGSLRFYDKATAYANYPNLTYNIINELNTTGQQNSSLQVTSRLNIDYDIMTGIKFNALLSYNTSSSASESFATDKSYYISDMRKLNYGTPLPSDDINFKTGCYIPFGGMLNSQNNTSTSYMGRFSLSFSRVFGDHGINAMVGGEARSVILSGTSSTTLGYLPDRGKTHVLTDPLSWPAYAQKIMNTQPSSSDSRKNEISYFASLSYSFQNRYILNANVRGDASNKLGQDKSARFLPIWSASGRWNIADESFMENTTWIEGLNIHASIGLQGNVTEAHNPNMIVKQEPLDGVSQQYQSSLISLPNRGLLWEKTRSINIGTDFSFFNGRLSSMIEYYNKKGKNQLVSATIESTNGATSVTINQGNISNKGWEISISGTPVKTKNASWNLSFNTSKNYNKITRVEQKQAETVEQYLDGSLIRNGNSVHSFYSYRFGGVTEKGEPTFLGIQAKDKEGNILISNREEAFKQGLVYSGKREPDFSGGLSTYIQVKNFSLNASFVIQFGSKIRLNDLYNEGERIPFPNQNMTDEFVNRWRKPGDEKHTNIPKLTDESSYPRGAFSTGGETIIGNNIYKMYNYTDFRVVSGNFVRCNSISLSYSFPANYLKSTFFKSASLNCSISNPFVLKDKALKGRDPEQVTMGSGTIPPQKSYSWSLSVTF